MSPLTFEALLAVTSATLIGLAGVVWLIARGR